MKLNINMPHQLKPFYLKELKASQAAFKLKDYTISWNHLERAHILGQPYPIAHTQVHWKMLCFGIKIKNLREVIGQLPRLMVGGIKSFVGYIPVGNTGGANVSPLKPMAIPSDLAKMIFFQEE